MRMLEGKKALVLGVANQRSIAWGVASALSAHGARVRISCQEERLKTKIERVQESRLIDKIHLCDVNDENSIKNMMQEISTDWGNLDILVHSIAYAPIACLEAPFHQVSKSDFNTTFEVSAYSLISTVRAALPMLEISGGSVMTLSYLGGERVLPGYGIMGPAKAALESCVRYLAYDLGSKKIRVNAISAGPLKTLASSAFGNFNQALKIIEEKTPLHSNISINDVGQLAAWLSTDGAKMITGGTHYVDSGANIMGG